MGQRISADVELVELQDLLGRDQAAAPPKFGTHPLEAGPRQHVKAWKFEPSGRSFNVSAVQLCDEQGKFGTALQRTASYLILHVWGGGGAAAEPLTGAAAAALEELATHAEASCSPRGLSIEVSSREDDRGPGSAASPLRFAVFVWHGLSVEPLMKAHVFAKAFELDRVLRAGLLWQHSFLDTLNSAVALTGGVQHTKQPSQDAHKGSGTSSEALHLSCNRLVTSILEGARTRGQYSAREGPVGARGARQRFPRLGLSLRRSLGAASGCEARRSLNSPLEGGALPSVGGSSPESDGVSAGRPQTGKPAAVPRLNLGGLGLRTSAHARPSNAPMDVDEDSSGRKRKGADDSSAAQTARESSHASTPRQPLMPKSARESGSPAFPPLALGKIGTAPDAPQTACASTAPAPTRPRGLMPALDLSAATAGGGPPLRPAAGGCGIGQLSPGMLNLEDINTAQEKFSESFDPENEENNYHMPHHVFKQLQLKHYRQECSEVVPGELFISSYQVASNLEILQRRRVTHIVNTAADVCDSCFPDQFSYTTYYLKDTNGEEISLLFYRTLEWIQNAISGGGRVLVHCREGVSRSATMVIAYLMWRYRLSFEAAYEKLRKARPICNPNTGFTCQLLLLGKKLGIAGGNTSTATAQADLPLLFRVAPHHAREPFLVLVPTELPASRAAPELDPRFGWVVQRGGQLLLWLGSRMPDVEPARTAVKQHAARLESFEGSQLTVLVVQEGQETVAWWRALSVAGSPPIQQMSVSPRPVLDGDFKILLHSSSSSSPVSKLQGPPLVPLAAFETPRGS